MKLKAVCAFVVACAGLCLTGFTSPGATSVQPLPHQDFDQFVSLMSQRDTLASVVPRDPGKIIAEYVLNANLFRHWEKVAIMQERAAQLKPLESQFHKPNMNGPVIVDCTFSKTYALSFGTYKHVPTKEIWLVFEHGKLPRLYTLNQGRVTEYQLEINQEPHYRVEPFLAIIQSGNEIDSWNSPLPND